jgi:hypothetical protein
MNTHERQRLAETAAGTTDRRFREEARTFNAPRLSALHRAWLEEGDRVIWRAESTVLPAPEERGKACLESVVLSRQAFHFSALVGVA